MHLLEKSWNCWTNPENIKQWNHAGADWHTPSAENDLRENGKFSYRMEAKDGSAGFDFEGIYGEVDRHRRIKYTLGNGRKVTVSFLQNENKTIVEEIFEAEDLHFNEMQKEGWQAILDNSKAHVVRQKKRKYISEKIIIKNQ